MRVLMRGWEEFELGPNGAQGGENLHVTLSKRGEITIGAKAYRELGEPEAAVLLFDRHTDSIGVAPAAIGLPNAYPMIKKSIGDHRVLRASRFCRHHHIFVSRTAAFSRVSMEEGILVLHILSLIGIGKDMLK